jgi:soluble lytic murein transglycosylase
LLIGGGFTYAVAVRSHPVHPADGPSLKREALSEFTLRARLLTGLLVLICVGFGHAAADPSPLEGERKAFAGAWESARKGQHDAFRQAMPGLRHYLLYPYLQYEDYRQRRAQVPVETLSQFLDDHRNWAFAPALETAWLRSLGEQGRWDEVLQYGRESRDVTVRCHVARARIKRGDTHDLAPVARQLWAAGSSQPDACDPVFAWLRNSGGITDGLAWERVALAMRARERNLARYAARFLDADQRQWAERWRRQDREGYRSLNRAVHWEAGERARQIIDFGLRRLARNDPDRAWEIFQILDDSQGWSEDSRGGLLAELALWSAVNRAPATPERVEDVPKAFRQDRLLEWQARYQVFEGDWAGASRTIAELSPTLRDDSRWLYWMARAALETGQVDQGKRQMAELASRATFYGFLAADALDLPYTICPEPPNVPMEAVDGFRQHAAVPRALELRAVGLSNWARSEWRRAAQGVDDDTLRAAAAVAVAEGWPDAAISALGNSGDTRWYDWRFPLDYIELVRTHSSQAGVDPSWVMGLMRSESALAADAISHAGARGLMQVTPQTATQLARRHKLTYRGRSQLLDPAANIMFGTTYMAEMLERFKGHPVLATGAYNAGPRAVDRWIADGYTEDPVVWIETLPYFETRDYIPRVMAFATIYAWRLGQPVPRVSSRMPPIGLPQADPPGTTEVVCRTES